MFSGSLFSHPVLIALILGCAVCSGAIAYWRGRPFWRWFLAGILFGPLALVCALVFVLPKHSRGR